MWIKVDSNGLVSEKLSNRLVRRILSYFRCYVTDYNINVYNNGSYLFTIVWVER